MGKKLVVIEVNEILMLINIILKNVGYIVNYLNVYFIEIGFCFVINFFVLIMNVEDYLKCVLFLFEFVEIELLRVFKLLFKLDIIKVIGLD